MEGGAAQLLLLLLHPATTTTDTTSNPTPGFLTRQQRRLPGIRTASVRVRTIATMTLAGCCHPGAAVATWCPLARRGAGVTLPLLLLPVPRWEVGAPEQSETEGTATLRRDMPCPMRHRPLSLRMDTEGSAAVAMTPSRRGLRPGGMAGLRVPRAAALAVRMTGGAAATLAIAATLMLRPKHAGTVSPTRWRAGGALLDWHPLPLLGLGGPTQARGWMPLRHLCHRAPLLAPPLWGGALSCCCSRPSLSIARAARSRMLRTPRDDALSRLEASPDVWVTKRVLAWS